MEKIECKKCNKQIVKHNYNKHEKACKGPKLVERKEEWKQENGLYKCPYCGIEKVKKSILHHILYKHINNEQAKENAIKNSGFLKKYGLGRKSKWEEKKHGDRKAYGQFLKGVKYEERYGKQQAEAIKNDLSKKMKIVAQNRPELTEEQKKRTSLKKSEIMKAKYKSGWKPTSGSKRTKYYSFKGIKVHGTYELKTCFILDKMKELKIIKDWEYTKDHYQYIGVDNIEHTYFIDFKVFGLDNSFYYIETKGWEMDNDRLKWDAVRKLGYKLEVWKGKQITELIKKYNVVVE